MEAYIENRSTLEALLSKMQIDFECLKTSCGTCNICKRCALLDNKNCYHPEEMRYSMEAMGMDLAKLSEEIFDHKLTWNSENKKSNICTSIGSILFNGTFLEDDFCDLARNYRFQIENFNFKKLLLAILIITYNNEKGVFQNNFLQYFETLFLINLNISSLQIYYILWYNSRFIYKYIINTFILKIFYLYQL